MIEKIKFDDYRLDINKDPPNPGECEENNYQENTLDLPNDSPTYFNYFFLDQTSEDIHPKEEKEDDKNQDTKRNPLQKDEESGVVEEDEKKIILSSNNLNINNIQFRNDINISKEDNADNVLDDYKLEKITTIINNNSKINSNFGTNFPQHKNSNIEIVKNKNHLLNENLIVNGNSKDKIISKKFSRKKSKIKYKKKLKRIVKKYYIIHFIRFLKKYGNNLIKKSKLQKGLHNDKLYSPTKSLILFLLNEDNPRVLLYTVKDIFCYKKKNLKNNIKINNEKFINKIFCYIDEGDDKIISFFNMNVQDACKLFEESKEFNNYTAKQKIIIYNKDFKQKFGFCLTEKNEFIKMIKNNGNDE